MPLLFYFKMRGGLLLLGVSSLSYYCIWVDWGFNVESLLLNLLIAEHESRVQGCIVANSILVVFKVVVDVVLYESACKLTLVTAL